MRLIVDAVVSQGRGLALDTEGKQVLVRDALPGEIVEAVIQREHRSYSLADTIEVLQPHPRRITPPCPYWGICGGCDFQYADQVFQAELKESIVTDALSRTGKIEPGSYRLEEQVTGSGWAYRSRARFFVNLGAKQVGFMARGSNTLVSIDHCPVVTDSLNALLADPRPLFEAARAQMFANRVTKSGLVEVPAFGWEDRSALLDKEITIEAGGRHFTLSSMVFFQSNVTLLGAMGEYVSFLVEGERVMDLYSGVGTFSAFLDQEGRSVTAVERQKQCLNFARRNAPHATFYTESAESWAQRQRGGVDTVIVDPPRVGLNATLPPLIASWNPSRVIYVSCDEASLARDVQRFVALGYSVQSLRLFDLYPQTFHTESVVLLTRS
ncbi:MAG: class I SAM-dependent RNA methyltransferase [Sphaerochaeta sp.]|jgi:23S rRNA (uracil1939-C5)-methyltransferase